MSTRHRYSLVTSIIILFVLSAFAQAQRLVPPMKQVAEDARSFRAIRDAAEREWDVQRVVNGMVMDNGVERKVPGWKIYKRWEYFWEQRVNQQSGEFPQTNSAMEFRKFQQEHASLKKGQSYGESWINLGTNTSSGGYAGIGRINCVAFHPSDTLTIWVGSPSGGIWKTTDGGTTWTIINGSESVLGVSDIAVPYDYATSQTLYVATGDRDGGSMWTLGGGQAADNVSIGVMKSIDGGAHWSSTGLTYAQSSGKKIYRLLIDPTNTSVLIASTSDGIYKTTNGGTSWTQKSLNRWIDMEFNPADHNLIYAGSIGYGLSYINRSTNNGETWTMTSILAGGYRTELAVSANNSSVVYALCSNSSSGLAGVMKSTDNGATFARVDDGTKSMLYYYSDGSGSNIGQGSYDLCIAASPVDANLVYIGGVNSWKSSDGGSTWTIMNMWTSSTTYNKSGAPVVHADKHAMAFQTNSTLFEGNDGGIYRSRNNGTTWADLTNGLVISQIYRLGVSQTDANVVLTGLQDNGSKKYRGAVNTWVDASGGDGMECIVDFTNATTYMYTTYTNGTIYRNTNGFSTSSYTTISANIPGGQPKGAWVAPYIMHPNNSATLYAAFDTVYRTSNRGSSWTAVSQSLSTTDKLRSLAIAPSNPAVLYTADKTHMWKTTDSGTTAWQSITLPTTTNSLTSIAVKSNDPNIVWITYGGYTSGEKVYQSTDGGGTWTNISSGLPNIPMLTVVHYKAVTDRTVLFAGGDVGVYIKDGTNDWTLYNANLPSVVVTELEVYYGSGGHKLRAATFGRGLWETEITSALPVELASFSAQPHGSSVGLQWVTASETECYGFDIECRAAAEKVWTKVGFVGGSGTSNAPHEYSFTDQHVAPGDYAYRLRQIDKNGQYRYFNATEVHVGSVAGSFALNQNYPNPFNPSTVLGYHVEKAGPVTLKVYDQLGREVATLFNGHRDAGDFTAVFNASGLSSGLYLARLTSGNRTAIQKMVLMK